MTLDDLRQMLDYHYWARDRVLDAAGRLSPEELTRNLGGSFSSVRDTLAHVYAAERVWCSRWLGASPGSLDPGDAFGDVGALRRAWLEHEARMRSVLETFGEDGAERVVEYRDTKGKAWRQPFGEMLHHVVNHASYHRGQVTTMLRQLKAAPPASMDLIVFQRERAHRATAAGR
jgi:uncharacterized damage-inducible protein DinB